MHKRGNEDLMHGCVPEPLHKGTAEREKKTQRKKVTRKAWIKERTTEYEKYYTYIISRAQSPSQTIIIIIIT